MTEAELIARAEKAEKKVVERKADIWREIIEDLEARCECEIDARKSAEMREEALKKQIKRMLNGKSICEMCKNVDNCFNGTFRLNISDICEKYEPIAHAETAEARCKELEARAEKAERERDTAVSETDKPTNALVVTKITVSSGAEQRRNKHGAHTNFAKRKRLHLPRQRRSIRSTRGKF